MSNIIVTNASLDTQTMYILHMNLDQGKNKLMSRKIQTMLASQDEEVIKQGIDLIRHLGLEEEIESGFKEILDEGEATLLQAGPQLRSLFMLDDDSYYDEYCIDEELIQACFFAFNNHDLLTTS